MEDGAPLTPERAERACSNYSHPGYILALQSDQTSRLQDFVMASDKKPGREGRSAWPGRGFGGLGMSLGPGWSGDEPQAGESGTEEIWDRG